MLAAAFLSSAGFSPSLRIAAPLTAAQPRYAPLVMSQPPRPQLELPAKLLELGCDAELWSEVQPRHEHTARPHRVVQPGPVCGTPGDWAKAGLGGWASRLRRHMTEESPAPDSTSADVTRSRGRRA